MRNIPPLWLVVATLSLASPAFAKEFEVTQSGKKFSERKITLNVGDVINFVNDDTRTHNIHSTTSGFEFDLGAQAPGSSMVFRATDAGKLKIRCAIHPKMKLIVTVE